MTSVKSLTSLVIFSVYVNIAASDFSRLLGSVFVGNSTEEYQTLPCTPFGDVDNASVVIQVKGYDQIANILCDPGFGLEGPGQIHCKRGQWKYQTYPSCIQKCEAPPYLKNGALEIDGKKDSDGYFAKGSLATYVCIDGYTLFPNEAKYRVCEKGAWTGSEATCLPPVRHNCPQPKDIHDGYYVLEKPRDYDMYVVGQRIHYSCKPGFTLVGSPVQQCLEDGTWSPKIQPFCSYQINENTVSMDQWTRKELNSDHVHLPIERASFLHNQCLPKCPNTNDALQLLTKEECFGIYINRNVYAKYGSRVCNCH